MSDADIQIQTGRESHSPRPARVSTCPECAITKARIQEFAQRIACEFHPERIILFGSHVRGNAGADSDVDLLVIMPSNGKTPHQQAAEIYLKCPSDFPVDVLVRTPEEFECRLRMRDWFMRDIAQEGVTLYAA